MAQKDKTQSALSWLFAPLEEMDSFRKLEESLKKPGAYMVCGLDDTQRLHVLAGLARKTGRMLLMVTATDQLAQHAADDDLAKRRAHAVLPRLRRRSRER